MHRGYHAGRMSSSVTPTKSSLFTFEECSAYAKSSGIRTFKEWVAFKQRDPRAPSNPQRSYKSEWQGWTHFLGGTRRQRPPKSTWAPYAEARKYARNLGCKSTRDWMALSQKGALPEWVPTSPRQVYGDKFTGWSDFLGYEEPWMAYDEFRSYVRDTLKITSHTVWKRISRDQLDPRAPSHPDRAYKGAGWQGWPSLFGTKRHSTASSERGKSLAERFPKVAAEWHPTRNGDLTPSRIAPRASLVVWWKCSTVPEHEWSASARARTTGAGSCPHCASKEARENSLALRFPAIAAEVHPDFDLTADKIQSGSGRKVLWRCAKVPAHEWEMAPAARTSQGQGCPHCAGRRVSSTNNLAVLHPEVAREWHPRKNTKAAAEVLPGSHMVAWWLCAEGHESCGAVRLRVRGVKCPKCTGREASTTNNLAAFRPDLAREWHPTKNGDLTPEHVTPHSKQKLWWRCSAGHEWAAVVGNREKWSGCPDCGSQWTLNNIRSFVSSLAPHLPSLTPGERWVIFQQSGALDMDGTRRRVFFKELVTGRFPEEELEHFITGEKSTADEFLSEAAAAIESNEGQRADDGIDNIVGDDSGEDESASLPVVNVPGALTALNAAVAHADDTEAIAFLVASAKAKLWHMVFRDEGAAIEQARAFAGDGYAEAVKTEFINEYERASTLPIPPGYAFKIDGTPTSPNLMQRLIASRNQRRMGNWSGTGAGKTNAAILKTRVVGAKLTVVCCPNSVVDGWSRAIIAVFPDSTVFCKTFDPDWGEIHEHLYLVLNYEMFQQPGAEDRVREFAGRHRVDLVVIDEIQAVKQRGDDISRRRQMVGAMLTLAVERNPDLYVLGMSATPVINNLREGVALVEMISGKEHGDIGTQPSVANCMRLYQQLTTLGPRWMPEHTTGYVQREVEVDCASLVNEIRGLGRRGTPLQLEEILTKARLAKILDNIVPKTLVYTHYVGGTERLDRTLSEAISQKGWRVGLFTGDVKSGLVGFLDGHVDVLIASSAISTGVDGLQHVCNRLIINVLPWTAAEFEQLIGRIHRQGQTRPVEVVLPLTRAEVNGQEWSWCKTKMQRLHFKKSLADAAVDGRVPEGHLRSPERAYQDLMAWLERLSGGGAADASRPPITFELPERGETTELRLARFGDFSRMNARWNRADSAATHERLERAPAEWHHYHAELSRVRQSWPTDPQEEFIRWAQRRTDLIIGDFGCGRAKVRSALIDRHLVHSFDHVAISADVVACDMAHVPLDDETLNVAVFCLSLMGSNVTDYIREAYRTLVLDGWLHIYEPTARCLDRHTFVRELANLGFVNLQVRDVGTFMHVSAMKSEHSPRPDAALRGLDR